MTPRFDRRALLTGAAALAAARALPARAELRDTPAIDVPPLRDPASYTAYIPAACKQGQWDHYTCEFDAAWAVMTTYGVDAPLESQIEAIGIDTTIEPYHVDTPDGVVIYGGDILRHYSGSLSDNFLARSTGRAMRKVFHAHGLKSRGVRTREQIEAALDDGRLVWIKTTVDFKDWVPATWITPQGKELQVVLGNDHAAVVMAYNADVVVIRDVLGPTSTNLERPWEYEVPWDRFLYCWAAQGSDGLAVGPLTD
jgi:hypothetical protein